MAATGGAGGLGSGVLGLGGLEDRLPWGSVTLAGAALFLRELSFVHPLYAGIGLLLVVLGRRTTRRDLAASA